MKHLIPEEYTLPVEIASYDVGGDNRLRLSALLRYQQEAAEQHLAPGGFGWDGMLAHGMAFVSSRWHGAIHRLPAMGEPVTVTTWHRERRGARFLRCYAWQDAAGEEIIRGVMQFALIRIPERQLLRGDEFDRFGIVPNPQHTIACTDPGRWTAPPLAPTGEYTVRRSDVDRNGHMNNTRYADLCGDFIPGEEAALSVQDIQLHFAGETRLGDVVRISAARENGVAFVQGDSPRGTVFAARLVLEQEDNSEF